MHSAKIIRQLTACIVALAVCGLPAPQTGLSDDGGAQPKASPPESGDPRIGTQLLDPELKPLVPRQPRTAKDQQRIEALAWYSTGRLLLVRNDFREALKAFQKAADLDPDSLTILESLIPLAFSLDKTEEAIKYARRAVELDKSKFPLLRQLGVRLAKTNKVAEGIKMLEAAAKIPGINKKSSDYVMLMRDLGVLYQLTGRTKEAAAALEVVFNARRNADEYDLDSRTRSLLSSEAPTSYENLGNVFLAAERHDLAIQAYQQAISAGDGAGKIRYKLALAYSETEKFDEALAQLEKSFEKKGRRGPVDKRPFELLALILKKQEKSGELIQRLEGLSKNDPDDTTLHYFLAGAYLDEGRLEDAEALYSKTLQSAASQEQELGFAGLARVYRRQNQPDKLLKTLADAYAANKSLKEIATELEAIGEDEKLVGALLDAGRKQAAGDAKKLGFSRSYVLAQIASQAEQIDAAEEFFRYAIATAPKDKKAGIYEELARRFGFAKKYAQAAEVLQEAEKDPAFAGDRGQLAQFLYSLTLYQEYDAQTTAALETIGRAMQLIAKNPLLIERQAWVYYHSRQLEEARTRYEKLIKDFPKNPLLRVAKSSLSTIYVQLGEVDKGIAVLEEIFKREPDEPGINNDLGYLYADEGRNLEKAEQMIRKAIEFEPENAAYLDSMGWVLYKLGKYEEALVHQEKASKKPRGQDGVIFDHLGDIYLRLQRPADAVKAWKKSLDLSKEHAYPDKKFIGRLEEKLKNLEQDSGKLKPQRPDSP